MHCFWDPRCGRLHILNEWHSNKKTTYEALNRELWLVVIVCFSLWRPMRVCLLWVVSCDWLWLCVSVCSDQWESVCFESWAVIGCYCVFQSAGTSESLSALVDGLPAMLYRQYAYEEPIVRSGRHLMHSAFFKVCLILCVFRVQLMLLIWWQERRLACKKYSHNNCHKFTFGRFGYQPNN